MRIEVTQDHIDVAHAGIDPVKVALREAGLMEPLVIEQRGLVCEGGGRMSVRWYYLPEHVCAALRRWWDGDDIQPMEFELCTKHHNHNNDYEND